MYDNQNNDPWRSPDSSYFQAREPDPPPAPPDNGNGNGNGIGRRAVLAIAAIVLVLGITGGGIAGGAVGYMLNDGDGDTTVVTATPAGERASALNATPPTDPAEETSDGAAFLQTENTPTAESGDSSDASNSSGSDVSPADIYEQVNPAVVTVINQVVFDGGLFNDGNPFPAGAGTGFIISEEGYIVTNNHVVDGSDGLQIIFYDGSSTIGTLVGTDPRTDLALIKVDGGVPGVVPLGDSDALRPGEEVVAIGSALGDYNSTVTAGVVSGLGRQLDDLDNLVQHDAPINPGNSGGPLLNMNGEVVAVNVAVIRTTQNGVAAEGLAFAIPSSTVEKIVSALIDEGSVTRPFLGISFDVLSPSQAAAQDLPIDYGAIVMEVSEGGPVADSGIQAGDIITTMNGEAISQDRSLQTILFQYAPGDTIEVEVFRPDSGETLTFQVTLGTRPSDLD